MRVFLLFILLFFQLTAYTQNKVSGVVKDVDGSFFPGAIISEVGTENRIRSDINGKFQFQTIQDSCTVIVSFIGYETKTFQIISDTLINVILQPWHSDYKWVTIETSFDALNSIYAFALSNGFDEYPLYHYEDFSESIFYKVNASTNFNSNHSFNFKIAHNNAFRYVYFPTIAYRNFKFSSSNFHFKEVNLSFKLGLNKIINLITLKGGYQELNGIKNYGPSIGFMNRYYLAGIYYGASIGYWMDYLTYEVHFQSLFFNKNSSFRLEYERIDNFDFLKIGFHYTFNRAVKKD